MARRRQRLGAMGSRSHASEGRLSFIYSLVSLAPCDEDNGVLGLGGWLLLLKRSGIDELRSDNKVLNEDRDILFFMRVIEAAHDGRKIRAGGGQTLKLDQKSSNKTEGSLLVKISTIHESSRLKDITCFIDETNFVDEDVFKQARAEPNLNDP
ncbi:hypothetical protein Tco_1568469 [Tanacetum coccineum]